MTNPDRPAGRDLLDLVPKFLEELRRIRRMSPHTIAAYARDLEVTFRHIGSAGAALPASSWTRAALEREVERRREAGASPSSIARVMSTWRTFGEFCMRRRAIRDNPVRGMRPPAFVRGRPRAVPREQLLERISTITGETAWDARDRALLELLASCGMLVSELTRLRFGDVDVEKRELTLRGRWDASRVVPVSDRALVAIEVYARATGRNRPRPKDPVFEGTRREKLSERTIQRSIRLRLDEIFEGQRVTSRTLRESVLLWMIEDGVGLEEVQRRMGHRWMTTTQFYLEPPEERRGETEE